MVNHLKYGLSPGRVLKEMGVQNGLASELELEDIAKIEIVQEPNQDQDPELERG